MNKYVRDIINKLYQNVVCYNEKTGDAIVNVEGLQINFNKIYRPGRGGRPANPCKIYINNKWYEAESERALCRLLEENGIYISRAAINKNNKDGIVCMPSLKKRKDISQ